MLACSACHNAGLPLFYRKIAVSVEPRHPDEPRPSIRDQVAQWQQLLQARQSYHHVRTLEIHNSRPVIESSRPGSLYYVSAEQDPSENYWGPLVALLEALKSPTDLIWLLQEPFPPVLLTAVQSHHSHCRLHIVPFKPQSFCGQSGHMDADELALITSPNLHRIEVPYSLRLSSGIEDYNMEAVQRIVSGLAPSLREVRMVYRRPPSSPALLRASRVPRKPWQGVPGTKEEDVRPGRLSSLGLNGGSNANRLLDTWSRLTDFTALRRLSLTSSLSGQGLRWASTQLRLPNLTELSISLSRGDEQEEQPSFAADAIAFFASLRPLYRLVLRGAMDQDIVRFVLRRLGSSIRRLTIRPYESMYSKTRKNRPLVMTLEDLVLLQESCPRLHELSLPIKRSKGDATEVAMYRALGKIRSLSKLSLYLDCSAPWVMLGGGPDSPISPSWTEHERKLYGRGNGGIGRGPRIGHIRDALINSATDEQLATAIWHVIRDDQPGRRLACLEIRTGGGADFGSNSYELAFMSLVDHLSRSYVVRKSVREGDDSITVEELSKKYREDTDRRQSESEDELRARNKQDIEPERESLMGIFFEIWPPQSSIRNWRDDWRSFPLRTG